MNRYRALYWIQPHRHSEGSSCVAGDVNQVNSNDLTRNFTEILAGGMR